MKAIICPVSPLRVNGNAVRVTAFMIATMIMLYAYTDSIYFILAIVIDFFIRAFTSLKYSPFSWLAYQLVELLQLPNKPIDKAPKMFAARVGFLFTLAITALSFVHFPTSIVVGFILMGFALLEAVFNFCVGCLVYSYIVLPLFQKPLLNK